MMREKINKRRSFQRPNERKDETESANCYECNKPSHIKKDCPNLKGKAKFFSRRRKPYMLNGMNQNQVIPKMKKKKMKLI